LEVFKVSDYLYSFEKGLNTAGKDSVSLLGGKGANLQEMCSLSMPVPKGITISTKACKFYLECDDDYHTDKLLVELVNGVVEYVYGGEPKGTELYSVRSGAAISMPGMMDTILNVFMPEDMTGLCADLGARTAWDCRRRYIQMLGTTAFNIPAENFENYLKLSKNKYNVEHDSDLSEEALIKLCGVFEKQFANSAGIPVPWGVNGLHYAIRAVFDSWNSERAKLYRKLNNIPDDLYTAVTIQKMVFGNKDNDSCSGVFFTRNPASGDKNMVGEYLINAQGEDVVAGIRTPTSIWGIESELTEALKADLYTIGLHLEEHYKDVQDIEFTVESGELYVLQTRNAKRSFPAACHIANEDLMDGFINLGHINKRISYQDYLKFGIPSKSFELLEDPNLYGGGLAAGGGLVSGIVCTTSDEAVKRKENGNDVILVRDETSPEDLKGMAASVGVLTFKGGVTSHAAVVGRGMGLTCVVGANLTCSSLQDGDFIAIDGTTGKIYSGKSVKQVDSGKPAELVALLKTLAFKGGAPDPTTVMTNIGLQQQPTESINVAGLQEFKVNDPNEIFEEDDINLLQGFGCKDDLLKITLIKEGERLLKGNDHVKFRFNTIPTEEVSRYCQSKGIGASYPEIKDLSHLVSSKGKVHLSKAKDSAIFGNSASIKKMILDSIESKYGVTLQAPEEVITNSMCCDMLAKKVFS
jgi:pyruvate,orthophosphate dikinase